MITVSPSLATITAPTTSTPAAVIDGAAVTTGLTIVGIATTPTVEGFSTALNSQINLLVQPTTGVPTLTTQTAAMLAAVAPTTTTAPVAITDVATNSASTTQQPTITSTAPVNLSVSTPESTMSASDTAILSNVNDTLKYISTGSKLGDTLPTGQAVQLPTANSATPLTQQSVQSAVQQAVTNVQVNTPAAVLAQQATPVQTTVVQQAPIPEKAVVTAQIQTPGAQQTVTPEKPVVTAQTQTLVAQQIATPEKAVVTMQVQTPVVQQAVTTEKSIVTTQVQTPVVQQNVTAEKPAVTVQTPMAQPTSTTEKSVVTTPAQQAAVQVVAQEVVPAQITPVEIKAATKNVAQKTADVATQAESSLLAETATLSVTQNISVKAKVGDSAKPVTPEIKKSENQDAPVVAQQATPEIVAPIVTAQATPVHVEGQKATFETVNQTVTPDEKQTLTPAKNLLMEAVANRSHTNGDTANNGGNSSNPTLQTATSSNPNVDNKAGSADTKSFASLLTTEKTDGLSASATAPTVDKAAPQNVTAAVNKLVQDTKVDVPAMTRPLTHPAWNQEMGERIVWMNNQGISSAEIKMNPQNMGPITVRIDMNQDQATIAFTAQNSDVRTALENSIPKLREMLSSQNVNLADVNVSQQSSTSTNSDSNRQQQTAQMMADASANGQGNRQNNPEVDAQGNPVRQVNGNGEEIAVDDFANGHVLETNGTNGLLSVFA
jgi:flagellar hook-length control protein FliK